MTEQINSVRAREIMTRSEPVELSEGPDEAKAGPPPAELPPLDSYADDDRGRGVPPRGPGGASSGAPPDMPEAVELSQDALALEMGQRWWDENAKYVHTWGKWLFWDGVCWRVDDTRKNWDLCRDFLRSKADQVLEGADQKARELHDQREADRLKKWAKAQAVALRHKMTVASVEALAQSNRASAARSADFDSERMLLGTPGGTVDLRTGTLRAARRSDMITKQTAVAPAEKDAEANDWTSGFELIRQVVIDALMSDAGGLVWVNRVGGEVRELIRYRTGALSFSIDTDTGERKYRVHNTAVASRDVIHLLPPLGRAPLTLAREAIGIVVAMDRHAGRLFTRGARPSGALMFPKGMGEESVKKAREAWRQSHEGEDTGGRTAILFDGTEFKPFTFTSTDAQFLENRRFQIEEIARAFNIPAPMVGDLSRATWSNSEQKGREFLSYTLEPWLRGLEGALRRALFSDEERASHVIRFAVGEQQRGEDRRGPRVRGLIHALSHGGLPPLHRRSARHCAGHCSGRGVGPDRRGRGLGLARRGMGPAGGHLHEVRRRSRRSGRGCDQRGHAARAHADHPWQRS